MDDAEYTQFRQDTLDQVGYNQFRQVYLRSGR